MAPLVLFIDIDGTLVGDVTPQVCEWEIIETVDKSKLSSFRCNLIDILIHGLLRPNIADFLTGVKRIIPDIEFFVFTASDMRWANFLVPCIEKAIDIKFNRPIFTRNHCIDQRKSLDCVLPHVLRRLKKQHPKISMKSMRERIALVDNNDVLVPCESHRCIKVPTYGFAYYTDILSKLAPRTIEKNHFEIATILERYNMSSCHKGVASDVEVFRSEYYKRLGSLVASSASSVSGRSDNDLWLRLLAVMKALHPDDFKEGTLKKINKMMKKTRRS